MPVRRYCSILVGLWNKITIKSHTILQLSSHDKQKKTKPTAKVQQHTRRWNSDGWLRQQGSPHLPSLSSIPRGKAEGRGLRLHARAPTRPALTSGTAARAVPARAAAGARKRSGGTGRPRTAGGDPRPRSRAGTPRANRAASDRRRGNAKGESRVCAVFLSKVTRPSSSGTAVRPSSARPPPRDEGRGPRCQRFTGRRLPATRCADPGTRGTPRTRKRSWRGNGAGPVPGTAATKKEAAAASLAGPGNGFGFTAQLGRTAAYVRRPEPAHSVPRCSKPDQDRICKKMTSQKAARTMARK